MVRLILSFLIVVVIFASASAGCIQPPADGSGDDQPAWPQIVQTPHPTLIPTGAVDPTRYRYVSNFSKVLYQINILEDWGLTQEDALAFDAGCRFAMRMPLFRTAAGISIRFWRMTSCSSWERRAVLRMRKFLHG